MKQQKQGKSFQDYFEGFGICISAWNEKFKLQTKQDVMEFCDSILFDYFNPFLSMKVKCDELGESNFLKLNKNSWQNRAFKLSEILKLLNQTSLKEALKKSKNHELN